MKRWTINLMNGKISQLSNTNQEVYTMVFDERLSRISIKKKINDHHMTNILHHLRYICLKIIGFSMAHK